MLLGNVQYLFHWMLFDGLSGILQHTFWQVKLSYCDIIDVAEPWQDDLQVMWYCALVSNQFSNRGIRSSCVEVCSASHLLCLCAADPEATSEIACLKKCDSILTHDDWTQYSWVVPFRNLKPVLSRNAVTMSFLCPVGMPMVFYVHPPMVPVFQAVTHSSQDLSVHPISHIRAGEYICCCPLSLAYHWSHKQKGCG